MAHARRGRGLAMAEEAAVRAQAETVRRLKHDKADPDEVRGSGVAGNGGAAAGLGAARWDGRGVRSGAPCWDGDEGLRELRAPGLRWESSWAVLGVLV